MDGAVAALVWLGVAVELVGCIGFAVARTVFDRLHYTSVAATVGPFAIASAILLEEGWTAPGINALVVAVFILVLTPVVTHATARIAHVRLHGPRGEPRPTPGEE